MNPIIRLRVESWGSENKTPVELMFAGTIFSMVKIWFSCWGLIVAISGGRVLRILVKQLAEMMSLFVKQVADKHCQSVTFDSLFFSDARTADSRSVQSFAILKIMTIIRGKNTLETGILSFLL